MSEPAKPLRDEILEIQGQIDRLNGEIARKDQESRIILQISSEIIATLDLPRVQQLVLSVMDGVLGFEHSMILLLDEQGGTLRVAASRGYDATGVGAVVTVGQGVIGVVAKHKKLMRIGSLGWQKAYMTRASRGDAPDDPAAALPGLADACSQIAIPLMVKGQLIGVFAVESAEANAFDALDEQLLTIVANQVAAAIHNAQLYEAQRRLTKAYERFVPREMLRFLQRESIVDVRLGDQVQRDMSILFCDIRSFTSMSEKMTPKENFDFINEYLRRLAPVIERNRGFIDKYIGDAIMALFPEQPDDAVAAAVQMHRAIEEYNRAARAGLDPIRIGIGIHTGSLMLGTVGYEERMEGTVISDSVNLASRLEGLTKDFGVGIVMSEVTRSRLSEPDRYGSRFLDRVAVKGKEERVAVYEVFERAG